MTARLVGEPSGLPRPLRVATVTLAVLTIALAGAARLTGGGHVALPGAVPVETRSLLFADRADGGVSVRDARTGASVAELAPGEGGFVRGALRALARTRRGHGVGAAAPFHLTRWRDGRLTLADPTTGGHVELAAFGSVNLAAFAPLLSAGR